MKFELGPDNRNCPDSVLLEDLRRVAQSLGRGTVTQTEYATAGRFGVATLVKRFGSWNKALETGGLEVGKLMNIPKEELLEDLKSVASKLGKTCVSVSEYHLHGKFSIHAIQRTFGSWRQGVQEAGLTVSPLYHERATDEELLANIGRVWEMVQRQPTGGDLDGPYSSYGYVTYRNHFGTLRKALEAFVASINEAEAEDIATTTAPATTTMGDPSLYHHRTPRKVSWRLQFMVMRRDNFKCRITGRSPATDPTVILVVDHIVPRDKGGETVMENLQTLCREINIGKSNLDMYAEGQDAETRGRGDAEKRSDGGSRKDGEGQDAEEQRRGDGLRSETTGSRKDAEARSSAGNVEEPPQPGEPPAPQ